MNYLRKYWPRIALTALSAYLFFKYVCIPLQIHGASMAPTYAERGFNFCWRPSYLFAKPQRGDVVAVRLAGPQVMYLKRIVAFEGETGEFKAGKLLVDGLVLDEPYVKKPCDWNLPQRTVAPGKIYVIGDNRSVPMDSHVFGQTDRARIMGKLLW